MKRKAVVYAATALCCIGSASTAVVVGGGINKAWMLGPSGMSVCQSEALGLVQTSRVVTIGPDCPRLHSLILYDQDDEVKVIGVGNVIDRLYIECSAARLTGALQIGELNAMDGTMIRIVGRVEIDGRLYKNGLYEVFDGAYLLKRPVTPPITRRERIEHAQGIVLQDYDSDGTQTLSDLMRIVELDHNLTEIEATTAGGSVVLKLKRSPETFYTTHPTVGGGPVKASAYPASFRAYISGLPDGKLTKTVCLTIAEGLRTGDATYTGYLNSKEALDEFEDDARKLGITGESIVNPGAFEQFMYKGAVGSYRDRQSWK